MKEYKRQQDYRERKKKRRVKKLVRAKMASNIACCCYGRGAYLKVEEKDVPGFVDPETYEVVMRIQAVFFFINICIMYTIQFPTFSYV
jgi:hypothetical protein